jgi:AraC-like DNA-binding protein
MLPDPLVTTKAGFLDTVDLVLERLSADSPFLCGSVPCLVTPADPPEHVSPYPRFNVVLTGQERHATSIRGKRVDVTIEAGQCLYWTAYSWSIPFRNTLGEGFGVVVRPNCVRLIQMIFQAEKGTPYCAYHTALPLGEAGIHVVRAMNCFAEDGNHGRLARDGLALLLRIVRQHLADDAPAHQSHHRALGTWEAVQAYLDENFGRDVNREAVAREFDLHPNYLSALARQATGQAFHQVLESVRLENARRLLRDTNLKLARIAGLCGFPSANRLSKVFRRVTGVTPGRFRSDAGSSS